MKHRIILSYGDNEYLPMFTSLGHNLKEKNMFFWESKHIIKNGEYSIVISDLYKEESDEKKMNTVITYSDVGFVRGFLYVDGKEYPIEDYKAYANQQVEKFCYDNLFALRLPNSFSDGNHF
jgi:hypothetical protein